MSVAATTTGRIRRPSARLLVVLTVTALFLPPSAARAVPVGGARATVPAGVWPLSPIPTVVHPFDPPDSAYGAGHRGVDLAGALGAPVHAAMAGTVTFAGPLAGRGVVVVDHGDTRTTYEPVTPSVEVGDRVAQGAVLGTLTATQSHCLPAICLHWGWIRNADGVYLDPLGLIGLGRSVRLLPLWPSVPVSRVEAPAPFGVLPYGGWLPLIARLLR